VASGLASVFVYGTLKRGQSNHSWLGGARFLGRRRLLGAQLHDLGPYPMAVMAQPAAAGDRQGPPPLIHGELFAVSAAVLAGLDQLENVPFDYTRHWLQLGDGTWAWVYVGRPELVAAAPLVPFADWGSTPIFSYGSNLCPAQLSARCAGWDGSGLVTTLAGWRWSIHKIRLAQGPGADPADGAAGIQPEPGRHCWGVVHHLNAADRRRLDASEGVAIGHYRPHTVTVKTSTVGSQAQNSQAGECFEASTYVPTAEWSAEGLRPSADYASRILQGLAHWPFPAAWRLEITEILGGEPRHNDPGAFTSAHPA